MTAITDALGAAIPLPEIGASIEPRIGDLWEVAWDGEPLALVLIAGLRDTYLLAWPVTSASGHETFPCFPFSSPEVSDSTLIAWPDAEFGLNRAVLRKCIAQEPLTDREVRLIVGALEDDTDIPREFCDAPESDQADNDLLRVCSQAWRLGDIEWPTASSTGVINRSTWDEAGLDAPAIASTMAIPPARAVDLYLGEASPTESELEQLSDAFPAAFDLEAPDSLEVRAQIHPKFKRRLEQVADYLHVNEAAARDVLLRQARVAARQPDEQDALEAAMQRTDAAISAALGE